MPPPTVAELANRPERAGRIPAPGDFVRFNGCQYILIKPTRRWVDHRGIWMLTWHIRKDPQYRGTKGLLLKRSGGINDEDLVWMDFATYAAVIQTDALIMINCVGGERWVDWVSVAMQATLDQWRGKPPAWCLRDRALPKRPDVAPQLPTDIPASQQAHIRAQMVANINAALGLGS